MHLSKGENMLIKNHISRDINSAYRGIKALKSLVHVIVAKKDTALRPKLEFTIIVWSQVGPTGTTKGTDVDIFWLSP